MLYLYMVISSFIRYMCPRYGQCRDPTNDVRTVYRLWFSNPVLSNMYQWESNRMLCMHVSGGAISPAAPVPTLEGEDFAAMLDTPAGSPKVEMEEIQKLTGHLSTLRLDSNQFESGGEGSDNGSKVTHLEQTSEVEAKENTPSVPPVFDEEGEMNEDDVTVAVPQDESSKQLILKDDAMEAAANAATSTTSRPSVRMRDYLKTVKQAKAAAAAASDEPTADSNKALECKAPLPAKPNDWGKLKPVTAQEQEPPKPRGRKKKVQDDKEPKNDKHPEPKDQKEPKESKRSKAKAKAKSKPAKKTEPDASTITKAAAKKLAKSKKQTYEPLEVEGNMNDKGTAFDAYAAACATADVSALECGQHLELTETTTKKRKRKSSKPATSSKAARCDEAEKDVAGSKASKESKAMKGNKKRKSTGQESAATEHMAVKKPKGRKATAPASDSLAPAAPAASTSSTRKPLSAECKARYSRKSCAYKKALNIELKGGKSEEEAKSIARQVSSI